jgi:hypothetical protein
MGGFVGHMSDGRCIQFLSDNHIQRDRMEEMNIPYDPHVTRGNNLPFVDSVSYLETPNR